MSTCTCEPLAAQAQATRPAPPAPSIVTYVERYECPRCESNIPVDCVRRREQTDAERAAGVQGISVYCPACLTAFQATFYTAAGQLHRCGAIHLVDDPAEVESLKAGVELVRNGRRVRHYPAEPTAAAAHAEPTAAQVEAAALAGAEADPIRRVERLLARMSVELLGVVRELVADRRVPPPAAPEAAALDAAVASHIGDASPVAPDPVIHRSTSQVDDRPDRFDVDAQHDHR
jgi:hypothetical protein